MEDIDPQEPKLNAPQTYRLKLAIAATRAQASLVAALLDEAGVPASPENKLAMMQVLATNYAAEVHRKAS